MFSDADTKGGKTIKEIATEMGLQGDEIVVFEALIRRVNDQAIRDFRMLEHWISTDKAVKMICNALRGVASTVEYNFEVVSQESGG